MPGLTAHPDLNPTIQTALGRNTTNVPMNVKQFAPRLGFNWDITGDQVNQLRGGTGAFVGAPAYVWLSNLFGNSGVNILRTPGMKNVDLALMKEFHLDEHKILRFQTTFSDAFNHPNFGYPDGDISSPDTAPVISSTNSNYLSGSSSARVINFALRFTF